MKQIVLPLEGFHAMISLITGSIVDCVANIIKLFKVDSNLALA